MTYSWHFNTMRPCDKAREPIQGEFFTADAISNPGEALIREGIQNSLDARNKDSKIVVRISVGETRATTQQNTISTFLEGLHAHLHAPGNGLREIPEIGGNCPFLVFEDFGTTGLLGDPAQWNPNANSRNNFYHFFRAEGRSDKGGREIGRWGVGKQVFPRASRINSVFGLTVRSDDKRKLLMGMAILKSHNVGGSRYTPDGWFGVRDGHDDESLIMPIEDHAFIDTFCKAFNIQSRNDSGLTIVVPWCDLDLTDKDLIKAVVRGYFWPILRDQLEVIVKTDNLTTVLNRTSLVQEIKKIGGDLEKDTIPLIELAIWAKDLESGDITTLSHRDSWHWSQDMFHAEDLDTIRQRYESGERLSIRIPLVIQERRGLAKETHFDIFLTRGGGDFNGVPVFIRDGIIIPDVRRRGSANLRGVQSLVVAEDDPIAAFLGDAENPAHTQWQKDGSNFKNKYLDGPKILDFVVRSVNEIVRLIGDLDRNEDRTLIADLFSISALPEEPGNRTRKKTKPVDKGKDPDAPTPPRSYAKRIVIDRIAGGFVVHNGENADGPTLRTLTIRSAYQIRHGNPFKRYLPVDFDFSRQMKIKLSGATIIETKENTLRVKIEKSDFRIEVKGFDSKRDVRVEVRQEEENRHAGTDN